MEQLTIITICRNDRAGLERTFASVFGQNSRAFEFVVIDGASSDGSVYLITKSAERITKWISEPDAGIYDAQNKGWRMAHTPFVLFMNAGDTFASHTVLEQCLPLLTDQVDIVYGDAELSDAAGTYATKHHPTEMTSAYLMKETVAHQSQFIRRARLEALGGYDLRYPIAADYAFFAELFWKHDPTLLHAGLVVSRFDTTGASSDPTRKLQVAAERKAIQRRFAPKVWFKVYHAYAALNRMIGR